MGEPIIKVNIYDIIEKLQQMLDDEYTIAEIKFNEGYTEDDSSLTLSAIDPISETRAEYGEVPFESGEI